MNVLLGILKYPPDYAGDGLRLHRSLKRWMKRGSVSKAYVLTSWDHASSRHVSSLDGIRIVRPVECTCKSKFEGKQIRLLFKKIMVVWQCLGLIFAYFKLHRKIDLVLTSGSGWLPSLVAWLAFVTSKPLVKETVLLGSDDPLSLQKNKSVRTRWFFSKPFHFADLIVTISPPLEKACLSAGIPGRKIWSRLNPIEIPRPNRTVADLHPALQTDLPVILWVGTVTERKNVEFLVRSACAFSDPVRVLFVGPCPNPHYFEQLNLIRKQAPAHVEILFLGSIQNAQELAALYAGADLFWFASKKEGMGNVVAESLMCGTPVLTLPVMGIMREILTSLEDGEVVDTDNPRVFAAAASRWLRKEVDRYDILERARQRFSPEKIDDTYLMHFQSLVKKAAILQATDIWKVSLPAAQNIPTGNFRT